MFDGLWQNFGCEQSLAWAGQGRRTDLARPAHAGNGYGSGGRCGIGEQLSLLDPRSSPSLALRSPTLYLHFLGMTRARHRASPSPAPRGGLQRRLEPRWSLTRLGLGRRCADCAFSVELEVPVGQGSHVQWEQHRKQFVITTQDAVTSQPLIVLISVHSIECAVPLEGVPGVLLDLSQSSQFGIITQGDAQRQSSINTLHSNIGSAINRVSR